MICPWAAAGTTAAHLSNCWTMSCNAAFGREEGPRCILWRWVDELGPFCVSSSAGSMEGKTAPQSRGQRMAPGRAAGQASRRIPRRWGYQSTLMETGDARRCGLDSKQCSFLLPLVVTQRCQEKIRCTSTNMRRIFLLLMQLRLFKRRASDVPPCFCSTVRADRRLFWPRWRPGAPHSWNWVPPGPKSFNQRTASPNVQPGKIIAEIARKEICRWLL